MAGRLAGTGDAQSLQLAKRCPPTRRPAAKTPDPGVPESLKNRLPVAVESLNERIDVGIVGGKPRFLRAEDGRSDVDVVRLPSRIDDQRLPAALGFPISEAVRDALFWGISGHWGPFLRFVSGQLVAPSAMYTDGKTQPIS